MRVLITGGAGFIGANLAEFHLSRGDTVMAVDDLSTGSPSNVAAFANDERYRFEKGDIQSLPELGKAIAAADRIYHMAAVVGMFRVLKEPVNVTRVNVMGTERVLELAACAAHRPQVVIASSSSVYAASNPDELREDIELSFEPGAPLLNYALGKFTNEVQAAAYAREFGLPVVIARLFNTVGPRQNGMYGFVLPRFVRQAMTGQPITVFGDGFQTRSFCDVRDTVRMLDDLAGTPEANGQIVNVGNDRQITILALAQLIQAISGSRSPIEHVPVAKAYGQPINEILLRRPILDRMRALTGFKHQWTLERTIEDLIARHHEAARPSAAE